MAKYLSPKGWKILQQHKDCKKLKDTDLEKLLAQFESAEKGGDPKTAEARRDKIEVKFKTLKKANAKNRTLIKWMDQVREEAETIIATLKAEAEPDKEEAKDKRPAEPAPEKSQRHKKEKEAVGELDAVAPKEEPASDDEAKRLELREKLTRRLTRAKQLSKEKGMEFVLNIDRKTPGLILTRTVKTSHFRDAALLTGKKGKRLKGRCYGESGKHVFDIPLKPSSKLVPLFKKAALLHAGMKIKVKIVGDGDTVDDGEAVHEDAGSPDGKVGEAQKPSAEAQTSKSNRVNELKVRYRDVVRVHSPVKGDKEVAAFAAAMKKKDYDAAEAAIAKLEARDDQIGVDQSATIGGKLQIEGVDFTDQAKMKGYVEKFGEDARAQIDLIAHKVNEGADNSWNQYVAQLTSLMLKVPEWDQKRKRAIEAADQKLIAAAHEIVLDEVAKKQKIKDELKKLWLENQRSKLERELKKDSASPSRAMASHMGLEFLEMAQMAEVFARKQGFDPFKGKKGLKKPMTMGELAGIYGYSTQDYTKLNGYLRSNEASDVDPEVLDAYIQAIEQGLKKLPPFTDVAFRGDKTMEFFLQEIIDTGKRTETGFMSTGPKPVPNFGHVSSHISGVKTGKVITQFSVHEGEGEVLFPPGSVFKFVKFAGEKGTTTDHTTLGDLVDTKSDKGEFWLEQVN